MFAYGTHLKKVPAGPDGKLTAPVRYLPGENVAGDPRAAIELPAQWIAYQMTNGWEPLAMIHSHPGGQREPSGTDFEHFPWWMVQTAFVYYGDSRWLTQYWQPAYAGGKLKTRWTPRDLAASGELGLGITRRIGG